ncbi:DUF4382 domain-containing protein [Hymenobacter cellulosivorans]|uniref:DUF4382 domain-containing protein n=1 Tax=Hymenobacter cellulosivorans TaxID=2932249 RepID=A0ABY4FBK0_9BACT|nr:DUF4382 domain-containing protein [Hymenobacter cellulosivorans]UOQ54052.1 DUF4382 domain-containing protein [Hymenobacter cellulosivorans]
MKSSLLFSGLLAAGTLLTGCEDALQDVAAPTQTAAQDAKKQPTATYQAIYIDLQRVEVSQDADENTSSWFTLQDVGSGVRNLLNAGTKTSPLFVTSGFQVGTVKQLRLVLGTNNTIRFSDGRVVSLETPSGQNSGLKVKVNAPVLKGGQYSVMVSIDPNWQVVSRGNGTYGLKPVLDGSIVQNWGGNTEARASLVVTAQDKAK